MHSRGGLTGLLPVGETDEQLAQRLQAVYNTEAGTDSHAAVRAGSRPSPASSPAPSPAQTPAVAQVTHAHPEYGKHTIGCSIDSASAMRARERESLLSMQVVPGPLQSGAYPSIHHGTPGAAFPEASNSGPTARYTGHSLCRMATSGCHLTCTGSSALHTYLSNLPLPEKLSVIALQASERRGARCR